MDRDSVELISVDSVASIPTVILELHPGLTPDRPNIEIRMVSVSGGWVSAAQMIAAALGPAMTQAFAQMQQEYRTPRVLVSPGLGGLKR